MTSPDRGGDPPCWAHLFGDDEPPATTPGLDDAAVVRDETERWAEERELRRDGAQPRSEMGGEPMHSCESS